MCGSRLLAERFGARVEQFYALENAIPVDGSLGTGEASMWPSNGRDFAVPSAAEVWPSNGWLDGQPVSSPAILAREDHIYRSRSG